MKKLKFFDTENSMLSFITGEILETLKDDLDKMQREDRRHYSNDDRKNMKAKISDIESIEGHIVLRRKPEPSQTLNVLRSFMAALLPEMDDPDEPMSGGDAVQTLSDYWGDFKRAIERDEARQARDKKADQFIGMIARLTTEEEYEVDGMNGDDAVESLSGLIRQARTIQKGR